METKQNRKPFLPIALIFIITTLILVFTPSLDFLWGMDRTVMLVGNTILFLATAISFFLFKSSLQNNNVHAFLRMIYGGMFAKMLIVLFAALIYIMIVQKGVSKGAVFGCMFLYFVYTFAEISIIMKLSRKEKYVKERGAA